MALEPDPRSNRLLATLPSDVFHRWLPHLDHVPAHLGQVLCESGCGQRYVYFPTSSIVSLLGLTEDGATTELSMVGHEGVVGIALFMGGGSTLGRAVVRSAGHGFRLPAHVFMEEFNKGGPPMRLMLRYTQALITQMAQTAICNRHHRLDQQLGRWLLTSLDRLAGDDLKATQEVIANLLGVRREGVTEAALKLQRAGVISYARGHISVLEREGLAQRACECHGVVKREYARLLPAQEAC